MANVPQNKFSKWYNKWKVIAEFNGPSLDDIELDHRISKVIRLWTGRIPQAGKWKRTFEQGDFNKLKDLSKPGIIYRRSDRKSSNPGEHRIENAIITNEARIIFLASEYKFDPVVNAFPCAKDSGGRRKSNVEFDLLGILKANTDAVHPLICEIKAGKAGSKNPWYAAIENLRQLKLFIDNADNLEFIRKKRGDNKLKFGASVGIIIAEPDYYESPGQKLNSMKPTQKLLERLRKQCKDARVILAKWDKDSNRVDRVGGCDLQDAFRR